MDCLFCKIIQGDVPAAKVYEDEFVCAFNDIKKAAKHHILIIPKVHICNANRIDNENSLYVAKIFETAAKIADQLGFAQEGYRVITNCGPQVGQTVFHLHFHLLSGPEISPDRII